MSAKFKIGAITIRPHVRDGADTGRWQADVPANLTFSGRRERPVVATREEAERLARAAIRQVRASGATQLTAPACNQSLAVGNVIEDWIAAQKSRVAAGKKKASSLETNIFQLERIVDFLGATFSLSRLSPAHLENYQAARRSQGRTAETINSELATFNQVQAWAVKQKMLAAVVGTERLSPARKIPDLLTPDEYRRVLAALPARLRPLVRLLAETGCRWGEATNLRWEDIDLLRRTASITARDNWTPKTRLSVRTLHLSPDLAAELHALARTSEYVFAGQEGRPVRTMKRAFRTAVKAADIRRGERLARITPKTLRKCFATWHAERGTRESVLQGLIGHAPGSRVTRQFYDYARVTQEEAAAATLWAVLSPDQPEQTDQSRTEEAEAA